MGTWGRSFGDVGNQFVVALEITGLRLVGSQVGATLSRALRTKALKSLNIKKRFSFQYNRLEYIYKLGAESQERKRDEDRRGRG